MLTIYEQIKENKKNLEQVWEAISSENKEQDQKVFMKLMFYPFILISSGLLGLEQIGLVIKIHWHI